MTNKNSKLMGIFLDYTFLNMMYSAHLENNRKSQIVKNAISLVHLRLDWDLEVGEISKMESDHNDTTTLEELKENINSFYLINMSTLVFLMQCGFAFLEAGCVRSKNAINIIMKNMMDCLVASIAYWAIGYGIALVSKSLARKFKFIISPFDRVPETIHGLVQVVFSALGSKTTKTMLTGFLTTLSLQPVQPLSLEALQNVRIYMPTSPTALLS